MTVTQDTFQQYTTLGYHGALNTNFPWWTDSLHAEGAAVGFGLAIQYGTADDQGEVVATGATANDIVGITLRTQAVENNASDVSEYAEDKAMSVLRKGRVFLTVADGSTAGADVYIVPDTGEIVSTVGSNIQLPNARFVRTVGNGEVSEVEIG